MTIEEREWFLPVLWVFSGIVLGIMLGSVFGSPQRGALVGLGIGLACAGATEAILRWPWRKR